MPGHYKTHHICRWNPLQRTISCRPVNVQFLKDWFSTRQASRKQSARGSTYTNNLTCADVSSPTRPLKTSRTYPPPRRWIRRVCLLGPVNASPTLTVKMRTPASPRTGCLVLDSGARVQLARTAVVCLQLLLLPFHTLIHSGRIAWMISFTFLVQATQVFLDILLGLSVPSLPDRMACDGKSSLL